MGPEFLREEHSPKGGQRGSIRGGDEDKRDREQGGNIPGQDRIGVNRSCVRMGSDTMGHPQPPVVVEVHTYCHQLEQKIYYHQK